MSCSRGLILSDLLVDGRRLRLAAGAFAGMQPRGLRPVLKLLELEGIYQLNVYRDLENNDDPLFGVSDDEFGFVASRRTEARCFVSALATLDDDASVPIVVNAVSDAGKRWGLDDPRAQGWEFAMERREHGILLSRVLDEWLPYVKSSLMLAHLQSFNNELRDVEQSMMVV